MTMTPSRRLQAHRAYGRSVDAFETIAWRAPTATRFDGRPANDPPTPEPTVSEVMRGLPGWVMVVGGGVCAALLGAMLGGALHI